MDNKLIIDENSQEYKIIKIPCSCICHRNNSIIHIVACCNNGYIEHKIPVENEKRDNSK